TVAIADPSDLATIDSLTHLLHADINLQVASESDIEGALGKYYADRTGRSVDPQLQNTIEELTREHVEIEGRAGDDGGTVEAAAQTSSACDRQPPQNSIEHVHLGTPYSAGRTYPDFCRRQADRSSCFLPAHQPWRKHRHAYSGQGRPAPRVARTGLLH